MLTVTEAARIHLAQVLDNANASADAAVRFVAEDDTIKPTLDSIRSGDVRFEFAGKTSWRLTNRWRSLSAIPFSMWTTRVTGHG